LAKNAWNYFQPGVGVNPATGLHYGSLNWHYSTDWDAGGYIQAVLDAEHLGILSKSGTWGADYRIDKVLAFLETRELDSNNLSYASYRSEANQSTSTKKQTLTIQGRCW
jgi:hypothetical protein